MEVAELIRQATINRVKSEQAIRRSKSLVNCTNRRTEHARSGSKEREEGGNVSSLEPQTVRQKSREIREFSRQALVKSAAARQPKRQ